MAKPMSATAPAVSPADPRPAVPTSAGITEFSRHRGEGAAALQQRLHAAAALARAEFPDRVRHLWRYTDPVRLQPRRLLAPAPQDVVLDAPAVGPAVLVAPGQTPRLSAAATACGITVAPLFADADAAEFYGQAVPATAGYFEALNGAAWNLGLSVRIPRGRHLAEPLRVLIPAPADGDLLPRLLIVVEESASLAVVEEHYGGGAGGLVLGATEILAGAGAEVRHALVQRWADGQVGHLIQRAHLARDARFVGATVSLGGDLAKLDLGAVLAGEGARSEIVGVTLPRQRQHLDHHTLHRHTAGRTWSNIDFKAAVSDRARSAYTGLIRIERNAPGSEAYQENRNLLLGAQARADTIPELEILTDEVSCSHGATVAPVDPEQIHYLRSRGLPPEAALYLIVRGFVESVLAQTPDGVREELDALITARLAGLRRAE
ncbi:MAG: Fe-S cluster assembly protein SufD [Candidatus Krumholzibacteria bacterium]|nr:Fe-S cluster assembly protein SufD [Candidatus Krumholzibacteria bacterium]